MKDNYSSYQFYLIWRAVMLELDLTPFRNKSTTKNLDEASFDFLDFSEEVLEENFKKVFGPQQQHPNQQQSDSYNK